MVGLKASYLPDLHQVLFISGPTVAHHLPANLPAITSIAPASTDIVGPARPALSAAFSQATREESFPVAPATGMADGGGSWASCELDTWPDQVAVVRGVAPAASFPTYPEGMAVRQVTLAPCRVCPEAREVGVPPSLSRNQAASAGKRGKVKPGETRLAPKLSLGRPE